MIIEWPKLFRPTYLGPHTGQVQYASPGWATYLQLWPFYQRACLSDAVSNAGSGCPYCAIRVPFCQV